MKLQESKLIELSPEVIAEINHLADKVITSISKFQQNPRKTLVGILNLVHPKEYPNSPGELEHVAVYINTIKDGASGTVHRSGQQLEIWINGEQEVEPKDRLHKRIVTTLQHEMVHLVDPQGPFGYLPARQRAVKHYRAMIRSGVPASNAELASYPEIEAHAGDIVQVIRRILTEFLAEHSRTDALVELELVKKRIFGNGTANPSPAFLKICDSAREIAGEMELADSKSKRRFLSKVHSGLENLKLLITQHEL
jgi:hypothetical protein